jgi:hypothetical protein
MSFVSLEKLDWWFNNNQNVLFSGPHGVGKTSIVKSCFERNGLILNETFLYFSASTLDPWVDLIGVPKEVENDNGELYLDLVRPKNLYKGNIIAIFFDEYNRSPKKVRNAVMELIQFKSINGLKFPNLKVVWAAINPDNEDVYDVEKIDPAQLDRFHVMKEIPYACDKEFFYKMFGEEISSPAIEWWNELPKTEKEKISPRRLQYALDTYKLGGDLHDILPSSSNITKLISSIRTGSIEKKLNLLFSENNNSNIKLFFSNENNLTSSIPHIIKNIDYMDAFLPVFNKERLATLMTEEKSILSFVVNKKNIEKHNTFKSITRDILSAKSNNKLKNMIIKEFAKESPEGEIVFFEPTKKRTGQGMIEILSKAHSSPLTMFDTSKKIEIYEYVYNNTVIDLTKEEANSILVFLTRLLGDFQANDLYWYKDIVSYINFLLLAIENQEKDDIDLINSLSKNEEIEAFIKKLQRTSFWHDFYQGTKT